MSDPILTSADMDEIGEEFSVFRPDSCLIQTRTEGAPGADPTFSAGTSVACGVVPAERATQVTRFGGRLTPETDFVVSVPRGTSVAQGDLVTVNGQTMSVLNDPGMASFYFELILDCKASS